MGWGWCIIHSDLAPSSGASSGRAGVWPAHFKEIYLCHTLARNDRNEKFFYVCQLADFLRLRQAEPANLLGPDAQAILTQLPKPLSKDRIANLLARGLQLSYALESWQAKSIYVISRADALYPKRLKTKLKAESPSLLYLCGNPNALVGGGVAVVGSRNAPTDVLEYSRSLGQLCARSGLTVVSGGARGIDTCAMLAALGGQGKAIGILADSLGKAVLSREYKPALLEGRLLLASPYDPSAGFNVGHAMARNKIVYALADVAVVVNADLNKGGTWAGAHEQLSKYQSVPLFVRNSPEHHPALARLMELGAQAWPLFDNPDSLRAFVKSTGESSPAPPSQVGPATLPEPPPTEKPAANTPQPSNSLDEDLSSLLLKLVQEPLTENELYSRLKQLLSKALEQAVSQGRI